MIIIGFFVVLYASPSHIYAQVTKVVSNKGKEVITPGILISYHNEEIGTTNCTSCHEYFNSLQSAKCLKYHKDIQKIIAEGQGYHGTLTEQCSGCHPDLCHNLARFSLLGKHHALECKKCHMKQVKGNNRTKIKYTNLDFEFCASCHLNTHPELTYDKDCLSYHTMQGWSREHLIFSHNQDSQFKLVEKHAEVPCEKYHKTIFKRDKIVQVKITNIGKHCKDCHNDPHNEQFTAECFYCHSEKGWKDLRPGKIHTVDSAFPLKGLHFKVICHKTLHSITVLAQARFVGVSHECASCHNDPHNGQMTHSCKTCHMEQGWKGENLLFVHNKHSLYKIKDLHRHISYSLCHLSDNHKIVRYRPMQNECNSCHKILIIL